MRLLADDSGATAIEYGLILSLIFLVIVGAVTSFSTKFNTILNSAASNINGAL
ncbi:MAG TPA: Flp family type IVb pilin [Caulobacteraceae bacterium]